MQKFVDRLVQHNLKEWKSKCHDYIKWLEEKFSELLTLCQYVFCIWADNA